MKPRVKRQARKFEKKKQEYLNQQKQLRDLKQYEGLMLTDTTGKKLELGQLVDLQMIGMFRGQVVEINESTIARPGQPPSPPHVMVQLYIPKFVQGPTPILNQIYIVAEPVKPEEKEATPATASPGLIVDASGQKPN